MIYETLARVVFARAVVLAIRLHLTGHSTKHSGGVLEDSTLLLPLGVTVFVVRGVCIINSFLDFLLCLVLFVQEMLPTIVVVVSWMETVVDDTTRLFPALTPSTPAAAWRW